VIWIVGNKGMLGTELSLVLGARGLITVGSDREVDFTNLEALRAFASKHVPTWIVNCAAYTAVDKAEDETDLAYTLNVLGPKNLALVAREKGAKLFHLSTDYVFDGKGITDPTGNLRPWLPFDPVNPLGVYGQTKAQGEQVIRQELAAHLIVRTAWLYGQYGPNFVSTMVRLMNEKDQLGIIHDQVGTPTWAKDLAGAIGSMIQDPNPTFGTYHYSGAGQCSWYQFAQEIYRLGKEQGLITSDCSLSPLTTDQYPTKAKRPSWSVLDKTAIVKAFGVPIPHWKDSLANYFLETPKGSPS